MARRSTTPAGQDVVRGYTILYCIADFIYVADTDYQANDRVSTDLVVTVITQFGCNEDDLQG